MAWYRTADTCTGCAAEAARTAPVYAASHPPDASGRANASRTTGTRSAGNAARPSNSNIDPTTWWNRSVIRNPSIGSAGYVSGHRTTPAPIP
jgi:hypothetical protein